MQWRLMLGVAALAAATSAEAGTVEPLAQVVTLTPPAAAEWYCNHREIRDRPDGRRIDFVLHAWKIEGVKMTLTIDSPLLYGSVATRWDDRSLPPEVRFEAGSDEDTGHYRQAASSLVEAQPIGGSLSQDGPFFRRNRAEVTGRMLVATGDIEAELIEAEVDWVQVFGSDGQHISAGGVASARLGETNLLARTMVSLDPVLGLVESEDLVAELRNAEGGVVLRLTTMMRCSRDAKMATRWPSPPPGLGSPCRQPLQDREARLHRLVPYSRSSPRAALSSSATVSCRP